MDRAKMDKAKMDKDNEEKRDLKRLYNKVRYLEKREELQALARERYRALHPAVELSEKRKVTREKLEARLAKLLEAENDED